jgi:hypothetical protein
VGTPPFPGFGKGGDFYCSPLEGKRQGIDFSRDNDQVNVIQHETIASQGKLMQLGILAQQVQVNHPLGIGGEVELPRVPTLRYVVRNIHDHHAS